MGVKLGGTVKAGKAIKGGWIAPEEGKGWKQTSCAFKKILDL